ncbi:hypothetical protein K0M31_002491, partial [Melipona bicolor]
RKEKAVRSRILERERKRKRDPPAEDFLHFGRNGCSKLFQARVARGIAADRTPSRETQKQIIDNGMLETRRQEDRIGGTKFARNETHRGNWQE